MSYPTPVIPSTGTTFAQFQAGGPSAMIDRLIAVIAAATPTLAPTAAPTLSESGSGGTLPAATYWAQFTESNGYGETQPSPVSASQAITLGQDLVVTFPALQTGNTYRSVYVGTAVGGPFLWVAQGITAGSLTISAPLPSNSFALPPDTGNKTALTQVKINNLRAAKSGNLQPVYKMFSNMCADWNSGQPMGAEELMAKVHDFHIPVLALAQIANEIGVLMDAHPGTLGILKSNLTNVQEGTGAAIPVRTWP
jgi:hypothetical protein